MMTCLVLIIVKWSDIDIAAAQLSDTNFDKLMVFFNLYQHVVVKAVRACQVLKTSSAHQTQPYLNVCVT
jgi:hypothetical protein